MPKNKRDRRNEIDSNESEGLEEQEEELEKREEEIEEQALAEEPRSGEGVNVEDAPIAFVQGNWENEEDFPLSDETVSDFIVVGSDPDAVMEEMQKHTLDMEVQEDFDERQNMATDEESLEEDLDENTHQSPKLSGGDVDAAWDYSDQAGEESVGASVPTPDQDVVDELGEAFGINYDDDEELGTAEKLGERDLNRWELNPASARDIEIGKVVEPEKDPLQIVDEDEEEDMEIMEDELDELLEDEDLNELEEELREADVDPIDGEDEDFDDFDDEDLMLFEDDELDELDDEELL
jgi:hypothetical protein